MQSYKRSDKKSVAHYLDFLVLIALAHFFSGCSSIPINPYEQISTRKVAIEIAKPILKKFYLEQAPVLSPELSAYPAVEQLPGDKFDPVLRENTSSYNLDGELLLAPGDYVIPVMTFCMNSSASSPAGWRYRLSELKGSRAGIIQELNQKALPEFSVQDIQLLIWQLMSGLSYNELNGKSREVFDAVLPERKNVIQESFMKKLQTEWDLIVQKTNGLFPSFDDSFDEVMNQMGESGHSILEMKRFQDEAKLYGNDYSKISALINTFSQPKVFSQNTTWSKINDRVYARFVTKGSFQQIGQVELRVLKIEGRAITSTQNVLVPVPLANWVADPQKINIQPLSFSMVLGTRGLFLSSEVAVNPAIAAALLTSVLISQNIDWNSFQQLRELLKGVRDSNLKELIDRGNNTLSKAHDDLEKPLKVAGIIDKRMAKKTKDKSNQDTREYTKVGGIDQLEKDYDKLPGESNNAADGTPTKELPDGNRAVKRLPRLDGSDQKLPTLEIQLPKTKLRVKVRYMP